MRRLRRRLPCGANRHARSSRSCPHPAARIDGHGLPAVIVAGAVPVDVTVTVFVIGVPIGTWPKLRLLALAEREGVLAATPDPWICTVVGLLVALLDTVSVPLALPSAAGLNFSFTDIC